MIEIKKTDIGNVGSIDLKNGSRIYVNTDEGEYQHVKGKSSDILMLDEEEYMSIINQKIDGKIKGKPWICKKCDLDNNGVICSECKRMYNPADPYCELKD